MKQIRPGPYGSKSTSEGKKVPSPKGVREKKKSRPVRRGKGETRKGLWSIRVGVQVLHLNGGRVEKPSS